MLENLKNQTWNKNFHDWKHTPDFIQSCTQYVHLYDDNISNVLMVENFTT